MAETPTELGAFSEAVVFSELFQRFAGPAPSRQGALFARRDLALESRRDPGWSRDLRRHRSVRPKSSSSFCVGSGRFAMEPPRTIILATALAARHRLQRKLTTRRRITRSCTTKLV